MLAIKKAQDQKEERERRLKARSQAQNPGAANNTTPKPNGSPTLPRSDTPAAPRPDSAAGSRPGTANPESNSIIKSEPGETKEAANGTDAAANGANGQQSSPPQPAQPKRPWEHTEEILAALKTAFPLLALSMESMVDQIQKHFKCPPDEDAYRLITALLNDALSYVGRAPASYAQDVKLPAATEANITRFAETILPAHIRTSFEADFVVKKPTMYEYIHKLRKWRDKFESKLDRRKTYAYLEQYSHHLSEFRFQKFDEVEVPGQYLQHKDKNQDFIRIERILPIVDLVRSIGVCHRRLKIRGHDGSVHPFALQHPAARHCRREERILQLFRHFNSSLSKRKESRRRNLNFHLPMMIPLAPHIRMVQDDPTYISLQGVFEDHCRKSGMSKDEPVLFTMDKMRALVEAKVTIQFQKPHISS
jgi:transformation/transcription domain-associated protein